MAGPERPLTREAQRSYLWTALAGEMLPKTLPQRHTPIWNACLLATGVVFSLLVAEGVTRALAPNIWLPGEADPVWAVHQRAADPLLVYELRPGGSTTLRKAGRPEQFTYAINSAGIRDRPDVLPDKPPGTLRVVVLGDSVAFGIGVDLEETIAKQLERELSARNAGGAFKVECLNLGVCGYDSLQEVEFLRRKGLALRPDLLVLLYNLNDPIEFSGELGYFFRVEAFSRPMVIDDLRRRYIPNSQFLRWLSYRIAQTRGPDLARVKALEEASERRRKEKVAEVFERHRGESSTSPAIPVGAPDPGTASDPMWSWVHAAYRHAQNWARVRAAFLDLGDAALQGDFPVLVALVPIFLDEDPYPFAAIHRLVGAEAERRGFAVLDLARAVAEGPAGELSSDALHPNARGNTVVARLLADRMLADDCLLLRHGEGCSSLPERPRAGSDDARPAASTPAPR